ncbi:MAG: DUF3501 family protein [Deltaproteobacteria bacterium]|jgi:hypothetical protein|nr:DUF3501 family protein [Deltaproteobacteria bacterium]
MKKVTRDEILDFVTYSEQRERIRSEVMAIKAPRRIHLGEFLTFLFETTETVRYQVLEMVRTEQIVKEAEIRHELETYNELLGEAGELGCTLLIELEDPAERAVKLRAWRSLPDHLYLLLEDGERVRAQYDRRQIDDTRLSSVQFLKFATRGRAPVAIGADHPELTVEVRLNPEQGAALRSDLAR